LSATSSEEHGREHQWSMRGSISWGAKVLFPVQVSGASFPSASRRFAVNSVGAPLRSPLPVHGYGEDLAKRTAPACPGCGQASWHWICGVVRAFSGPRSQSSRSGTGIDRTPSTDHTASDVPMCLDCCDWIPEAYLTGPNLADEFQRIGTWRVGEGKGESSGPGLLDRSTSSSSLSTAPHQENAQNGRMSRRLWAELPIQTRGHSGGGGPETEPTTMGE
jgi:hypothetical protein